MRSCRRLLRGPAKWSRPAKAVYPVLHALEKDSALKSRRKTVNGRSRIYYGLTARGAKRLAALAGHWTSLNNAVQAVLHAV